MSTRWKEIPYCDPVAVCARVSGAGPVVLCDSALRHARFGRRSFLFADPFDVLTAKDGHWTLGDRHGTADPFGVLAEQLDAWRVPALQDGLLPGAAAGLLGYEGGRAFEVLPPPRVDLGFPDVLLGCFDVVYVWDHPSERAWIVSTGVPAPEGRARTRRATARLGAAEALLEASDPLPPVLEAPSLGPVGIDLDREAYEGAVREVVERILAGELFQANVTQRFRAPLREPPFDIYRRLRAANPAPFAAWLDFGDVQVASASPERFLRLVENQVETRPIKGTRPRGATPAADTAAAHALLASEKDRAENVMIVDLLRNDLSRVCRAPSVRVPELCALESYATVHHLVSSVVGELRPGLGAVDLLGATFPGGSITGAPKIRAMELLAHLEPVGRGPYCGSIGYLGLDGQMDTSIVIRTIVVQGEEVSFGAGGAVTAASDPASEYVESLDKARALAAAIGVTLPDEADA